MVPPHCQGTSEAAVPAAVSVSKKKSPPVGFGNKAPCPVATVSVVFEVDAVRATASVLDTLLARSMRGISSPSL